MRLKSAPEKLNTLLTGICDKETSRGTNSTHSLLLLRGYGSCCRVRARRAFDLGLHWRHLRRWRRLGIGVACLFQIFLHLRVERVLVEGRSAARVTAPGSAPTATATTISFCRGYLRVNVAAAKT